MRGLIICRQSFHVEFEQLRKQDEDYQICLRHLYLLDLYNQIDLGNYSLLVEEAEIFRLAPYHAIKINKKLAKQI